MTLAPVVLAGGLVACVSPGQQRVRAADAGPVAAGAVLVALALVLPVTLADAKLRRARDPQLQEDHPRQSIQAAQDAQRLDSTWAEPAITEGALRFAAGDRAGAAAAGRRAVSLEPRNWSVQYRASGLIGLQDASAGRAAFLAARALNPRIPAVVARPKAAPATDSLQNPSS
ncbi:MAG: hypothetical protein H7287_09685 [Thermoleophilia bacterium]|nr:hypothetical protein [Thermoleophilia bacterium]